jgi:hypothetical protein
LPIGGGTGFSIPFRYWMKRRGKTRLSRRRGAQMVVEGLDENNAEKMLHRHII